MEVFDFTWNNLNCMMHLMTWNVCIRLCVVFVSDFLAVIVIWLMGYLCLEIDIDFNHNAVLC